MLAFFIRKPPLGTAEGNTDAHTLSTLLNISSLRSSWAFLLHFVFPPQRRKCLSNDLSVGVCGMEPCQYTGIHHKEVGMYPSLSLKQQSVTFLLNKTVGNMKSSEKMDHFGFTTAASVLKTWVWLLSGLISIWARSMWFSLQVSGSQVSGKDWSEINWPA